MSAALAADVRVALNSLSGPFRQAVWLRDVEECSYAEIAQMLAIPVGTVMSRISRARRLLYERLSPGAARGRPQIGPDLQPNLGSSGIRATV